jgi:uncharacterized protein (DUF1778 family)
MSDGRERIRIELRVSRGLADLTDELADVVGLRRNAFFVLAASKLALELSILYCRMTGAKRDVLFDRIEKDLLAALAEARKTL